MTLTYYMLANVLTQKFKNEIENDKKVLGNISDIEKESIQDSKEYLKYLLMRRMTTTKPNEFDLLQKRNILREKKSVSQETSRTQESASISLSPSGQKEKHHTQKHLARPNSASGQEKQKNPPLVRSISSPSLSGNPQSSNLDPNSNRGGKPPRKTLKFYQNIARARRIPFSKLNKAQLIQTLKSAKKVNKAA